jgi:Protein of unknown function (DUF2721)
MALTTNPFVVLSYVGGPALLTNATSLLLLSTANRFARAIDRSRYLTGLLNNPALEALHAVEVTELRMTGRRIWLIGLAISGLYLAAAMFALATVMSIVGAVGPNSPAGPCSTLSWYSRSGSASSASEPSLRQPLRW